VLNALIIPVLMLSAEMIYPPTHQYFIHPDNKAAVVAYSNWDIQTPRHWQVDALITCLDHEGMLRWMILGWCREYTLNDFAQLAKQWNPPRTAARGQPPAASDPNTVPVEPVAEPMITFRVSAAAKAGGVYHLPSCRYVNDTAKTITIDQAELYRPCKVCTPDAIESLIAEFLPKDPNDLE